MDKSDNLAVLYANFDSMYSNEFCGSKAADFCCSSSFLPCIILKAAEAESGLEAYDQVFRRLYSFAVDRGGKAMDVIIVLASAGTAQQSDSIEDSVISRIRSIASDFNEVCLVSCE